MVASLRMGYPRVNAVCLRVCCRPQLRAMMGAKGRLGKRRSNEHLQKVQAKREARERDRANEQYKHLYTQRSWVAGKEEKR